MVLEDDVIGADGRTGYLYQSGSVLFFNIILIVNLRIFVLSSGISAGLAIAVLISIIMYWIVYYAETLIFDDFKLIDSIHEEWTTLGILLVHAVIIFFLIGLELFYNTFMGLSKRGKRLAQNPERAASAILNMISRRDSMFPQHQTQAPAQPLSMFPQLQTNPQRDR